ncbi:MAG: hypothetical protein HYU67_12585 [Flavobacteriia bacterium]|nr:hypothetical protein [Flavobacteriia bacterium]
MKTFVQLFYLSVLVTFIFSCSSKSSNSLDNSTLAYLNGNSNALVFGKIDLEGILNKTSYKEIPKMGVLIVEELKKFKGALDLSQKINFVLEGPFEENNPKRGLLFSKIKNEDSLKNKILSMGYSLQKRGNLQFFQDKEVALGFQDDLLVLFTQKGEYQAKTIFPEIFKSCKKDPITGKTEKILSEKGDIIIGVNYENLYKSSVTGSINKEKQEEFKRMMEDSYTSIQWFFENGYAQMNIQNLFSDAWLKRLTLTSDASGEILKKLGKGKANIGLSILMDTDKLQSIVDDYASNSIDDFSNSSFEFGGLLSSFGNKPFSGIWNGKLGLVQVGDVKTDGSFIPEINFFMGLGHKGKTLIDFVKAFMPGTVQNPDGTITSNGMNFTLNEKEISGSTKKNNSYSTLEIPNFAKGFGTKGIQFFADFDKLDIKSLELEDNQKFIYAIKNIHFEMDNEKGKLIINGKNASQNILKQMIDVYVDDIKDKIGHIN